MIRMFPLFLLVVLPSLNVAIAQSSFQPSRIGVLVPGPLQAMDEQRNLNAFFESFKQLGYVAGKNINFEFRAAERNLALLPRLATELVQLKVAVMVVVGTTAIDAAIKITKNIPIVMISGGNPVARGFVKSAAVPGGNVTGMSSTTEGDEGKRLELLKETFPWINRVLLLNADKRTSRVENYRQAEPRFAFFTLNVFNPEDLKRTLGSLRITSSDALIAVRNAFTISHAEQIAAFALKNRLPSIYESREFVDRGGLMSYGVNYTASWQRSAFFVDKILKGARPAVLPIEPPQFEFLINLKTAAIMKHRLPPEILLEANEIIN